MPYGWGTGGVQVTAAVIGPDDVLKVIDQGADDTTNAVSIRAFFAKTAGVATTERTEEATIIQTRHRIPETPLPERADPRLPGADPRTAALPRAARNRDAHDARAGRIRRHACEALRGHRPPRPYRDDLRLSASSPTATSWTRRRSRNSTIRKSTIARRCSCSAPAAKSASMRSRPTRGSSGSTSRIIRSSARSSMRRCALCGATDSVPRRGRHRRPGRPHVRLFRHRLLRRSGTAAASKKDAARMSAPLCKPRLCKRFGAIAGLPRNLVRSRGGRGAGDRRRIRLRQDDAAQSDRRPTRARRRPVRYRAARRRDARSRRAQRSRAARV